MEVLGFRCGVRVCVDVLGSGRRHWGLCVAIKVCVVMGCMWWCWGVCWGVCGGAEVCVRGVCWGVC